MAEELRRQLVLKKGRYVVLGSKENQGSTLPSSEEACQQTVAVTAKTALMSKTACKTWIPPPRAHSSIVGSCILATVFLGTLALLCSIYSGVTHSDPNGFSLSSLSSSLPHNLIMKALEDTEAAVQEPRNFEDCHGSTILGFSHAASRCIRSAVVLY